MLLATLVGQGGTLPLLLRLLRIRDDGQDDREEHLALSRIARVALIRLAIMRHERKVPAPIIVALRQHHRSRRQEFADAKQGQEYRERVTSLYRTIEREALDVQRAELIRLRDKGKIDNTVMRRVVALLDLEYEEIEMLSATGQTSIRKNSYSSPSK